MRTKLISLVAFKYSGCESQKQMQIQAYVSGEEDEVKVEQVQEQELEAR